MDEELKGYRRLKAFRKADELVVSVYKATANFPRHEMFGLTLQMRRAAISVPANIAEGYARPHDGEKKRFYSIALASLTELEYYIDLALKLGYITEETHFELADLQTETAKLLTGLIKSVSAK